VDVANHLACRNDAFVNPFALDSDAFALAKDPLDSGIKPDQHMNGGSCPRTIIVVGHLALQEISPADMAYCCLERFI